MARKWGGHWCGKKNHWKILGDEKIYSPRAIMIIMSIIYNWAKQQGYAGGKTGVRWGSISKMLKIT
jgi:hypothetical protein